VSIAPLVFSSKLTATRRLVSYVIPLRADRGLVSALDELQVLIERLQRSWEGVPQSRHYQIEVMLSQCAREAIVKGVALVDARPRAATESVVVGQGESQSSFRVAEWVNTLESMRRDQRRSGVSDTLSNVPSFISSSDGPNSPEASPKASPTFTHENNRDTVDAAGDDSSDDLYIDLAKAALDTGTKALEAQEWEEANALFQETLQILQQLPKRHRAFCDIFGLQYKLTICAYHVQEPAQAEEALISLVQQPVDTDEQRARVSDAVHLLSQLYIRMGQLDRARSECEKALQARRRLLGKQSDASLESTALMAHIYFLLNNRALAKSCLAMIPESRRDAILKGLEHSLGTSMEQMEPQSPQSPQAPQAPIRPIPETLDPTPRPVQERLSIFSVAAPIGERIIVPASPMSPRSPAASLRLHQRVPSHNLGSGDRTSIATASTSSTDERSVLRDMGQNRRGPGAHDPASLSPTAIREPRRPFDDKMALRKQTLEKVRCQPKDGIEEAVCDSDYRTLNSLLNKKKDSWRSKWRKRTRPERVTALHFAALFGEIEMARCLLGAGFNVNEVPFGYSTVLTPLTFAIGARQVNMVAFLIANGAKPSKPDSWSTLASLLMNRSWLHKTMDEAGRDDVPNRITAILELLLQNGWDVNAPFDPAGRTVLHQAVQFWTGSIRWDLHLRLVVALFLCERGADAFQANTEGKTPYDMATESGHQDLILLLGRGSKNAGQQDRQGEPFELYGSKHAGRQDQQGEPFELYS